MINLNYIKNQKINEIKLVNILFCTFPVWFILGNLIVSIHTLLFIIASIYLIRKRNLSFRFNKSYWILSIFFTYLFISTAIQFGVPGYLSEGMQRYQEALDNFTNIESDPFYKSFFLFRFLILIIIIDTLFFNKILNLKSLLYVCLCCTSFVSLDVIFQYLTGQDIFGYKSLYTWNSGPFGDEKIASTYLKNFSFLSFFCIFSIFNDKKFKNLIPISIVILHLLGIFLAGNRMPFILFLLGFILIIILVKNIRFIMIFSLIFSLPFFFLISKYDKNFNYAYLGFISEINLSLLFNKNKNTQEEIKKEELAKDEKHSVQDTPKSIILLRHSGYNRIFRSALLMWKEGPVFGFGLKSFRIKCWDMLEKDNIRRSYLTNPGPQYISCANHPHNYYLELLAETGLVGFALLFAFFLIILKNAFFYLKENYQDKVFNNNILIPFLIIFLIEIWPIKSTGSFFTTWGATFFWFNLAMVIAISGKKKLKNLT